MRAFIWNFALVCVHSWTFKPEDSEELCTAHHTRTAVYSCWVLVPAMSSPVITSDCFLTEVLLSMNKSIMPWDRVKVCNELVDITGNQFALIVGLNRMFQSLSGHYFILFQGHHPPWRVLKPMEARCHHSTICIHRHFKLLFPTGVIPSSPKHTGTGAHQLTKIKSAVSQPSVKKCGTIDSLVSSHSTSTIKKPHAFWRTISTRVGGYHLCNTGWDAVVKNNSLNSVRSELQ